ncbi:hypothetical protein BW721_08595 [Jeotgalibaca sp. PTS2502]|uniref:phage tail protein n=1 Tax=Jeotgalibaca sp. PTS2502 TaxID=1903686 RepID=UPI00097393C4|nr:hypothetical protein [Jeotgalibaca sp. PTS2502]APZ49713.1 hypothetical protein BW721_08595 [Jeotgalibaca sp. PTS2502]
MATELGQAYVQIIPSAKGISGKIQEAMGGESEKAGKSAGLSIAGAIKGAIAAAGIGAALKSAISEGAALEQSIGGIDTLFGDSAAKMKEYANEAYKTAGLSANDFMQQATSFSASLLKSVGGDTEAAAEAANMAMIDMGDNANKMGTSIEDIQNAYQGFAKGNYQMLDNLKLGYSGTKGEMEKLLSDATKLSGVDYNIDNLDDVYQAVHVIQEEMGITGTTAKEAAETLGGSFAAMQGAFKNFKGNLTLGNDIGPSMKALAETASTYLFDNLIPAIGNIIQGLPSAITTFIQAGSPALMEAGMGLITSLSNGVTTGLPVMFQQLQTFLAQAIGWLREQFPTIVQNGMEFIVNFANGFFEALPSVISNIGQILNQVLTAIVAAVPTIMQGGYDLITGLAQGLWNNYPMIIQRITSIITGLLQTILENFPAIVRKGMELIGKLASGIWNNLPMIISTMGNLIANVISKVGSYLPKFLSEGMKLIGEMAVGIINAIPGIVAKIPQVIRALISAFSGIKAQAMSIGSDLVMGLWNGIASVKDWIIGKIGGFTDSVVGSIKGFFGIKSPSRVMRDEVGKFLPEGLAVGIEGNIRPVTDAMDDMANIATGTLQSELALTASHILNMSAIDSGMTSQTIESRFYDAMDQLLNKDFDVYIDGRIASAQLAPGMSQELQKKNNETARRKAVILR